MKYKLSIAGLAVIILSSCSQEDMIMIEKQDNTPETSMKIGVQEALANADMFISTMDDADTRNAPARTVASIEAVGTPSVLTRSESTDTLLYIVNYEDNNGFVIMGADRRALPIYAISDSGNFKITDDTPETIKNALATAQNHAAASTANTPFLPGNPFAPWPYFKGWDKDIQYKIGPLLTPHQARLSGMPPYSKYIFDDKGNPASTGCVMVSVEQIMSYHKWPTQIEGLTLDWDKMNAGEDDDAIARVLELLGRPQYLNAKYEAGHIATAFTSRIITTFQSLGYQHPGYYIDFFDNVDRVIEALHNGPIAMSAYYNDPDNHENDSGHSWVVDGMIRYKVDQKTPIYVTPGGSEVGIRYRYYNLFHSVWGFGDGDCNGYYFTEFEGEPEFYDETDNGNNSGYTNAHYTSRITCLPGFRPVK